MSVEIERKFLIDSELLEKSVNLSVVPKLKIIQGYLSTDSPTVRIRFTRNNGIEKGFVTIKGPGKLSRSEFEYEIPGEDAKEMLYLAKASLSKIRYEIVFSGFKWEVDYFVSGKIPGLWLAEIELSSEDEYFEKPDWLKEEVTYNKKYSNAKLAQ